MSVKADVCSVQRMTLAQAASLRGIQESSAAAYLAEAIMHGHGYFWPMPGVYTAGIPHVVAISKRLLIERGVPPDAQNSRNTCCVWHAKAALELNSGAAGIYQEG